jgi:phage terminase large subunit-like protein
VAQVAELLGQPLMPWQRDVLDVALEVDAKTGLLVYREVVLTVPRQSGKTWLLLCLMVHRALGFGEPQSIVYTAQNRLEARKKWEDDFVRRLERSPLRHRFKVRKQIGQEAIRWENGSLHGISSATERSGHGSTLDLAVLDEAFAQDDARLEQALKPTMVTRPEPQMWIVSTAGNAKSVFLRGKVIAGRANVAAGLQEGSAFFEWSAADDADPASAATWWGCMPALGHSIDESVVRADFLSMDLPEFCRAYLNQGLDGQTDVPLPVAAWNKCRSEEPRAGEPWFSVEVESGLRSAAIAAAGETAAGRPRVALVEQRPDIDWVVARCGELGVAHVAMDVDGAAAALVQPLEEAGIWVVPMRTPDAVEACLQLQADVIAGRLAHPGDEPLDRAVEAARQRDMGDAGGWVFGRKKSGHDISALQAVAWALWLFRNQEDVTIWRRRR